MAITKTRYGKKNVRSLQIRYTEFWVYFFYLGQFYEKLFFNCSKKMPISTQTLKGLNSETVRPFELKFMWKCILTNFISDLGVLGLVD
jgi:hypothetical protein